MKFQSNNRNKFWVAHGWHEVIRRLLFGNGIKLQIPKYRTWLDSKVPQSYGLG